LNAGTNFNLPGAAMRVALPVTHPHSLHAATFLMAARALHQRVRRRIEMAQDRVATKLAAGDAASSAAMLNDAMAMKLVCALRCRRYQSLASGDSMIGASLAALATQQRDFADRIALRIVALGGMPDYTVVGRIAQNHPAIAAGDSLFTMIEEDLAWNAVAMSAYCDIDAYLAGRDLGTWLLMEEICVFEKTHAAELARIVSIMRTRQSSVQ